MNVCTSITSCLFDLNSTAMVDKSKITETVSLSKYLQMELI